MIQAYIARDIRGARIGVVHAVSLSEAKRMAGLAGWAVSTIMPAADVSWKETDTEPSDCHVSQGFILTDQRRGSSN